MTSPIEAKIDGPLTAAVATLGWSLQRQLRYGKYTLDFFVTASSGVSVIVETDGFSFHERTQEDAIADRVRDRFFLRALGVPTLRFLGAEVCRSPQACVTQVIQILSRLEGRQPLAEEHW